MHFPTANSTAHAVTADDNLFFTDVRGEDPNPTELVDYTPPNPETSSTIDSSEDEVIFNGRGGSRTNIENSRVRAKDTPASVQVRTLDESTLVANGPFIRETIDPTPTALRNVTSAKKKRNPRQRFQQAFFAQNDDAILADYVANMDSQYALPDDSSGDDLSDDQSELSDEDPVKMRRAIAFGQKNTRKPKGALPENELPDLINSEPTGKEATGSQDDSTDDEQSDDSEVSVSLSDLISYSQRRPPKDLRAKNMTQKLPRTNAYDDFLDYEKFADFDIMDLERDSLHKKKKKKKGHKLDFDLSDSDLEMQLQEGWERDRNKKKAKKREREQLRAQGLLGKRSKPSAEGAGITMEEVKTQVKGFLLSSADTLDLPPMDKKQRRVVHELANAVSLKSQSRGKGSTRYPVMYKTARTPNFNGKHSVKLDKILSQSRFVKIGNMRPRNYDKEPKKGKNIQRSKGDFGYTEGDVVGGSAPEIGANNKGRAMLEKMGWSSGTALGALNNKGILQPVTQVMKNSRAGLG
ncbi:Protein SQS1 [Talaromyces islandicus]|uniref:Protein SQS1 n=1 Tax=Talaromyces islandicus TaxID=28573 RepID=A0A0U1LJS9_TALIS|nr:Protein SQS1 [Talaromyces islandicus]